MRVGFIGVGSQGGPMAHRIIAAGFPTTLYARRPEALEPYGDGPAIAHSPAALAAASDLVCICVVDDAGVEAVLSGPNGVLAGLQPGSIVAVHSTVHPETCRRLASVVAGHGSTLLDAPVSGGAPAAEAGTLLVMVGGDGHALARCRPVFESYSNQVVHLGDVGAGQTTKLVNNLLFTAHLATAAAALELARGLGTDPTALASVLAHGSGASFALGIVAARDGDLRQMAMAAPLLEKDVRLVTELAGPGVTPTVLLESAHRALEQMTS